MYNTIITIIVLIYCFHYLSLYIDSVWEDDVKNNRRLRPLEKGHDYSTPEEGDSEGYSTQEVLRLEPPPPKETYIARLGYPIQVRTKPKPGTLIDKEPSDFYLVATRIPTDTDEDLPW